jgi:hypothetical protein
MSQTSPATRRVIRAKSDDTAAEVAGILCNRSFPDTGLFRLLLAML